MVSFNFLSTLNYPTNASVPYAPTFFSNIGNSASIGYPYATNSSTSSILKPLGINIGLNGCLDLNLESLIQQQTLTAEDIINLSNQLQSATWNSFSPYYIQQRILQSNSGFSTSSIPEVSSFTIELESSMKHRTTIQQS